MPEGIEIRVISEYLNKVWTGKLIIALGWDSASKFNRKPIKGLELVKVPLKVIGVFPRGKLIIIECLTVDNKMIYMVSQLGMEGKWVHIKENHSNFRLYFGNLNIEKNRYQVEDTWWYDDSRHFGHFNVYSDTKEIDKNHGPCLLTTALVENNFIKKESLRKYQTYSNINHFTSCIKNKRIATKEICDFLMKQKYLSGVGNYLKNELLYRCKINPHKLLGDFTDENIKSLYNAILEQMLISYGARGLTIKSYWDPEGNKGKCPLQVYKKDKDPLGNLVETFKDKEGRTVHWVPIVQIN